MLFGVVLLLVIAHAYRFALNIYQVPIYDSHHEELDCCGRDATNQIIHIGAYALLTLSCSGNCFIYLATSKPFREVALKYYRLIFSSFHPSSSSKSNRNFSHDNNVEITARQQNVTPITPFGIGFISRGIVEE